MNLNERLSRLENAIMAIENGAQEYQIGSRRVRKADLKTLYLERDRVERKILESQNDGISVAVFEGR